jgi:hypothetical protein
MICVLRVGGHDLTKVKAIGAFAKSPYRKDIESAAGSKKDVFYWDIAESEERSVLLDETLKFLRENYDTLLQVKQSPSVSFFNLDIGVAFYEDNLSTSVELSAEFIDQAARLGISVSLSVYKTKT